MENISLSTTNSGAEWSPSDRQKLLAWTTHLFTASGAVWGLLATVAIVNGEWLLAFGWMAAAVFVDSFDGLLARRAQVKRVLPEFDGALLDNIVDFLNYVFVPALFLYMSNLLPANMAIWGAGMILLASAFQFCQNDAKTEDHFFKGFPSYWNIIVFYLFILALSPWLNLLVLAILSILVFVPIKYIYPTRTEQNQKLTMALATVWGIANLTILFQYPYHSRWLVWLSLVYVLYYSVFSLYLTWPRHQRA